MPLQIEHRPDNFDDFIGNESAIEGLIAALNRDDVPRSYLFTGIPGSGKTSLAFIIKDEFEINDIDFFYYNSANTRGIDTVRQIASDSRLAPMISDYKIYVMDEIHAQTTQSLEALLLLLENPPEKTIFILCTSEPEKLKLSIKRRCFQCNLQPATDAEIKEVLKSISHSENKNIPEAIKNIITISCQKSIGMAVAMLDAIIDLSEEKDMLKIIDNMKGVADSEGIAICRALVKRNWNVISELLSNFNGMEESLRYMILSYFSKILLAKNTKMHTRALNIIINFSETFIYNKRAGLIAACYLSCHDK